MSFDKTKSCRYCPDRCVGCHGTCEGYQVREKKKLARYADSAIKAAAYPGKNPHEIYRANESVRQERRQQRHTGNRTDLKPDGTKYRHTHND